MSEETQNYATSLTPRQAEIVSNCDKYMTALNEAWIELVPKHQRAPGSPFWQCMKIVFQGEYLAVSELERQLDGYELEPHVHLAKARECLRRHKRLWWEVVDFLAQRGVR